jgi:hypothetical protein
MAIDGEGSGRLGSLRHGALHASAEKLTRAHFHSAGEWLIPGWLSGADLIIPAPRKTRYFAFSPTNLASWRGIKYISGPGLTKTKRVRRAEVRRHVLILFHDIMGLVHA